MGGVCTLPVRQLWVRLSLASEGLPSPSPLLLREGLRWAGRAKVKGTAAHQTKTPNMFGCEWTHGLWIVRNRWKQTLPGTSFYLLCLLRGRKGTDEEGGLERGPEADPRQT